MILDKNKLKKLIKESLEEMQEVDPIEELVNEVESLILSRTNGDRSALGTIGQELMWRESGGRPEPEYDEEAEKEHEKRFMQSGDVED